MSYVPIVAWILLLIAFGIVIYLIGGFAMFVSKWVLGLGVFIASTIAQNTSTNASATAKTNWFPPNSTKINSLSSVINGTGVHGFIFNNSYAAAGNAYYGGYNWCNMPHVNAEDYPKATTNYSLEYVEVIHRHHKRTPYASNTFPHESYSWNCDDEGLFYYGKPLDPTGNGSASTYWSVYTSPSNPFAPEGFNGTCQFPQITRGGLDDSWQHGKDLYEVYHDMLGFLPNNVGDLVTYRVSNNVITSQVAGMVVDAMYDPSIDFPLSIQPDSIDSLEPTYTCPAASALYSTYGVGGINPNWKTHLTASQPLYDLLDGISGVPADDTGFHMSWDHYFDNLSSRLCHAKPLPCKIGNSTDCVTESEAEEVFRLGEYEYSYVYRDAPHSLLASTASYGVWVAELTQNIRNRIDGSSPVIYRHNVAHDGSLSRLLSILQVDVMVWPGMGSEIIFEVYKIGGDRFIRILWGGKVFRSSNPALGLVDMLPLDTLLEYFDDLVGVGASKIPGLCNSAPAV